MSEDKRTEFNNLLGKISSTTPILFFPLRIETHFRKRQTDELCVRIFPDEIFLDYLTETLAAEEINDAKMFWVQWYLAGGNPKREYEAWQALCGKYPVYRAAWLVRQLKPKNIADFKSKGKDFNLRPFTEVPDIEKNIEKIYANLLGSRFILSGAQQIKTSIRNIEQIVKSYKEIVDYIYDDISEAAEHVVRYFNNILMLSERKGRRLSGESGSLSKEGLLSESDKQFIDDTKSAVESLMENIEGKRITLRELIEKYLNESLHKFIFPVIKKNRSDKPDMPVSNILPDRFLFIGEPAQKEFRPEVFNVLKPQEKIIHFGNKVKENLPMGIDPNEERENSRYNIDSEGDLVVDGGIDWMIDYDKAEAAGMAITVPIDSSIEKFNYIYVLGIKEAESVDGKNLRNLFNSHNYTSSGIAMLKTATPTNIVDGMEAAYNPDPELEMRKRYNIEVADSHDSPDKEKYDSMVLAKALNMNAYYDQCFGRVGNYDNKELHNAKEAYKIIWEYFFSILTRKKTTGKNSHDFLNKVGDFMVRYVRARGPYPAFRIENRPYSILPIGDLKKMSNRYTAECPNYLIKGLIELADKWKELRNDWVIHSKNLAEESNSDMNEGNTAAKRFLEMAGQTPYTTTFYERTLISSPLLPRDTWYPDAMKTHFDTLYKYGFFDPWHIGGSEEKVTFDNTKVQLSKVLQYLKNRLPVGHNMSDNELKLLVTEFYDIFTHRLDAWISGVFEHIREKSINKQPRIGAFGWVFNLERAKREEVDKKTMDKIKELKLLPKNAPADQKIYQNTGGEGYIIAPSVQHAITAAVLRAAYLKTKRNNEDSHLCINLSSMRTRQALRMVDGIKQGMSTSVILGADLERYLHEAYKINPLCEMDQYIYPLRKIFPQVVSLQAEDKRAHDHAMQVINGEALLNTFVEDWGNSKPVSEWLEEKYNKNIKERNEEKREDCIKWYFILEKEAGEIIRHNTVPSIREEHRKCLFKLIERLVDSYDALNDLLLAEGVHRLVMGDTASYSAINNFMAEGKGNLPEPAILDTPMEYVVVSHKTGIALPECNTPPNKPMCMAEPSINLWLEQLMGKSDNIFFYIETTNAKKEIKFEACTLKDLDIKPAEYLYISSNETLFLSYLETRWRLKYNRFAEKIKIHTNKPAECREDIIFFNEKGESIADLFTLYEDELRISKLRSIVTQSPSMKANDLIPAAHGDYDLEMAVDTKELESRYISLRTYLSKLSADMKSMVEKFEEPDEEACDDATLARMYEHLCRCTASGMFNSLPEFNSEMFVYSYNPENKERHYHINPITEALVVDKAVELQQEFIKKYQFAYEELNKRIEEADAIIELESDETYNAGEYVEAIKKLLLSNFKVCPRFTLHHALTQNERKSIDAVIKKEISSYRNLDKLSFEGWQFDVAEVREPMKTWQHVSLLQSISNRDTGKVSILQTNSEGTPVEGLWLGCKVEQEADLQDVDSFVIYNSGALTPLVGTPLSKPTFNSGLMLDAWNEFIPYKKQTAGMVFHCDQPDNEAPQALLLAMNPRYSTTSEKWQIDDILELLDFTRFMLMNRAVEPDHIYKDKQLSRLFPLLSTKELS